MRLVVIGFTIAAHVARQTLPFLMFVLNVDQSGMDLAGNSTEGELLLVLARSHPWCAHQVFNVLQLVKKIANEFLQFVLEY